jgi:hypothetical protein
MGEGMTLHRLPTCRKNFELEALVFAAPRRLSPWKERKRPSLDQRVRTKQDWKREGLQKKSGLSPSMLAVPLNGEPSGVDN